MSMTTTLPQSTFPAGLGRVIRALRLKLLKARVRRETSRELSALSQRQLDDIGVTHGMITRLANEAAESATLD